MASIREAFANEADAQSDFYREQQTRYQEVEPNRFLSDKIKGNLGPSITNTALSQFDKYDPYTASVSNRFSAAGLSEVLQGQSDTTDQEEFCRSFTGIEAIPKLISDQADDEKSPIRCGWRYKKSPVGGQPLVSQAALGTIAGPLNAKADPLGGGVEWVWNLKKAQKKHIDDYVSLFPPTAEGLRLAQQYNPNIAFCSTTQRFILVDSAGNPTLGYQCPRASLVRDPAKITPPPTQTPAASMATENAAQLVTCMTPGQGNFTRDCLLYAIRTQGCSADGTLYQAIEGAKNTATTWNTYLLKQPSFQTYQSRQGANSITEDMFRRDRSSWDLAVREIQKLNAASSVFGAGDPMRRMAARDLCTESGAFDTYDFCADLTDSAPIEGVELKCIQNYWQEQNGKPAGLLYPSKKPLKSELGVITTWGAYKQVVNQLKEKTNSTNPVEQRQAIANFLGVTVSTQGFSPLNLNNVDSRFILGTNPLMLWLDAKDGGTLTMDSSNRVRDWADKSPRRAILTQVMNANRATYVAQGFPGLQFNGTSSFYEIPNAFGMISQDYTIFVVERRSSPKSQNFIIGGSDAAFLKNLFFGYHLNTVVRQGDFWKDLDVPVPAYSSSSEPIRIWTTIKSGGSRTVYANGTSLGSDVTTGRLQSWNGAAIGRIMGGMFYSGTIYELLIYNTALSTDQRQKVEGYLGNKWGVSDSLMAGHPYKMNPP